MELNSLSSTQFSNVSQSDLNQLKSVNKSELNSTSKPSRVDRVELQNQSQSSSFANSLINNVKQISSLLSVTSVVSKQLDITNKIEQSISSVISSSTNQTLNDIQPKVKSLMDNFNNLSSSISTLEGTISIDSNKDEKSRVYFDGILGAKPLSSEEIFAEVASQRERLQNINKVTNDEVLNKIEQSKELFNTQREELETQHPKIKEFDFTMESVSFEPQVIQKLQGSVVDAQANAKTEQNIKLLAAS